MTAGVTGLSGKQIDLSTREINWWGRSSRIDGGVWRRDANEGWDKENSSVYETWLYKHTQSPVHLSHVSDLYVCVTPLYCSSYMGLNIKGCSRRLKTHTMKKEHTMVGNLAWGCTYTRKYS